ncbi:MAG TPA: MEDS domain-containing protein [Noviherbaspirillum sp.]|nr:MEDS domain-containing protein [Noviherbaspirillum sp.]
MSEEMAVARSRKLMDQLAAHVKQGDHVCVVCEDPQQRLGAAAQYIADGLRQNEFVMYAADAATTATLRTMLSEQGIDVEAEIARGALNLPTAYDAYLSDGEFKPDLMYETFERAIDSALAANFSGCRFAGEPVWAIDRAELRPGLIEFEARLNALFSSRKAAGLCVYDKSAWPAEVVRDIMRIHPVAVVDDAVCKRNVFYERPELVDDSADPESQVAWMLTQLREMRTEEARLEVALEAGQLGSWELDLRNDTSVRSLRHDQIFGYDHLLPEWGYARFIEHVLPEDRERVSTAFQSAIKHGRTWHFECRIRRHNDGAVRWIEAYGRPDPEGSCGERVQRLLGIVVDITERKQMEEALRETDRRKDQFLATLAHELRNPLAPILNGLQLMQSKARFDPELQQLHGMLDRQVRHLARLVDDLLDVSRITTGRIELKRERIELKSVLAGAIEGNQHLIDSLGHAFVVTLPETPIPLDGDGTRLTQVFLNILNNAAKYTPPGGRIELRAERVDGDVIVRVRDNGMGMQAERIPAMFQMFVQGRPSGEQAQGGLGIGLPLARQLLELHGGSIDAQSDGPGCGSEFTVRLPALPAEAPATPQEAKADAITPASAARRILVVDDNVDAADSLAAFLEYLGHQVHTRYDGQSALDELETTGADVVILDIGLPDLDGYTVARRMRALQPDLILVALTGWGQEQDRRRAEEAGFDLHRTKPVSPAALAADITQIGAVASDGA